jgi:hypothetical protein
LLPSTHRLDHPTPAERAWKKWEANSIRSVDGGFFPSI